MGRGNGGSVALPGMIALIHSPRSDTATDSPSRSWVLLLIVCGGVGLVLIMTLICCCFCCCRRRRQRSHVEYAQLQPAHEHVEVDHKPSRTDMWRKDMHAKYGTSLTSPAKASSGSGFSESRDFQ